MKHAHAFEAFTGKYQLSKTLRFELIPQGETLNHIISKGLLEEDEARAQKYVRVKKLIDEYHKSFVERALSGMQLGLLQAFTILYFQKDKSDEQKLEMQRMRVQMRKDIAERFTKNETSEIADEWKKLFGKELIQELLPAFLTDDIDKQLVSEFNQFTTYFTNFHDNRRNIYSADEKATAISFRLIHENLPKFLDNVRIYQWIKSEHPQISLTAVTESLRSVLQDNTIDDFFKPDFFNETLTQSGIQRYNAVLGGIAESGDKKFKGLNEVINLYNQKQKNEAKLAGIPFRKVPQLIPLFKQILSDNDSHSFVGDEIQSDAELMQSILDYYHTQLAQFQFDDQQVTVATAWELLLKDLEHSDLMKVYITNDAALTGASQNIFGDWSMISNALSHYYVSTLHPLIGKETKKYQTDRDKFLKSRHFSLGLLQEAIEKYMEKNDEVKIVLDKQKGSLFTHYLKNLGATVEVEAPTKALDSLFYKVSQIELNPNRKLRQEVEKVAVIKDFLDAVKRLQHFVKAIHPINVESEKDEQFYSRYLFLYERFEACTSLYNQVRNYLTKKPYSVEKVKLNFKNSTLLDGWDVNKEKDNSGVLLRRNGVFYLAIMDKHHAKVFESLPELHKDSDVYEKIDYKLLPGANKMLPKVFFSKKYIHYYNPSAKLLANYKDETHKKGLSFNLKDCHELIDFFKASIAKQPDWKNFSFKFSDTSSYQDLSGFYREVEQQGYKISFRDVSVTYINELVASGKIYLFQLYNKDFSEFSKGKPNLHTLYWKMLFEKENTGNVVYKLNGQAEVFYRRKSLNYSNTILSEGHHAGSLKEKFSYPIISNRRYAFDKFQLHVPITINFKANGRDNINNDVSEFLHKNDDVKIIGIDRGERHLLYISLIDKNGRIIEQRSLNEIVNYHHNQEHRIDYQKKLDIRESERKHARQDWATIGTIKELKEGYLSHVVYMIADMMVKHKAIVVMEDLNFGFKRGRQKVEKQVYQKFEKMLIDKLNCLVFKEYPSNVPGGVLKPLQLTGKFTSFKELGKQCGFLFYLPAALTSKIDPLTGFVNFLQPKYENVQQAKRFFSNFDSINFNSEKQWFEFAFDYSKFTDKADGSRTKWMLCTTPVVRYRWNARANQGKGQQQAVNITEALEDLFGKAGIAYGSGESIIHQICAVDNAEFHKELIRLLSCLLSLRHNNGLKGEAERDFILSPIAPFFNSNEAGEGQPDNADANGAYHIALKGLWAYRKIRAADDLKKLNLALKTSEWLHFVQQLRSS